MGFQIGDKIVCKISEGRMVRAGDICTITNIRGELYTFVANKNGSTVTGWWHTKLYPDDFELYKFNREDGLKKFGAGSNDFEHIIKTKEAHEMVTIEEAKLAVEAAEKQLGEAKLALEKAEAEKVKIGLKIPGMEEEYYSGGDRTWRRFPDDERYFHRWASTNYKQSEAFREALCVMAEMRVQDGIVNPVAVDIFYAINGSEECNSLQIQPWYNCVGVSLFPAFASKEAANKAIEKVGAERIMSCIKTMMFMTPESRGEVE